MATRPPASRSDDAARRASAIPAAPSGASWRPVTFPMRRSSGQRGSSKIGDWRRAFVSPSTVAEPSRIALAASAGA